MNRGWIVHPIAGKKIRVDFMLNSAVDHSLTFSAYAAGYQAAIAAGLKWKYPSL